MQASGAPFNPESISFISDVEGCAEYWERYIEFNDGVVKRDPASGKLIMPESDTMLVFGGDAFDKGVGDLKVAGELIDLKKRYPDRVILIMGNRDINKMKLSTELREDIVEDPATVEVPYFVKDEGEPYADFLARKKLAAGPAGKLRWLLDQTMGSGTAFENRRMELGGVSVSDEAVVKSFVDATKPGGVYYEYLKHAQLAHIALGTLFVHGAVTEKSAGFVPSVEWLQERVSTGTPQGRSFIEEGLGVADWVAELNRMAKASFDEWAANPTGRKPDGQRNGSWLLAYPHNKAIPNQYEICCNRFANPHLEYVHRRVVEFLQAGGIRRMVAGHMPTGDTPCIIQQPGMLTIISDTSYCDMTSPNRRGNAVAEVLLYPEQSTRIRGVRVDGEAYDFIAEDWPLVGRATKDGWWSKIVVSERTVYNPASPSSELGAPSPVMEEAEGSPASPSPTVKRRYLLHRTTDGYRKLTYRWANESELIVETGDNEEEIQLAQDD